MNATATTEPTTQTLPSVQIDASSAITLESAMRAGSRLHAFLSGGGLRVVRIEKGGSLKGYGEHYAIEVALAHAAEDFRAGGLPYEKNYGKNGKYARYLTGSTDVSCQLDAWVRCDQTFDVYAKNGQIVVELLGYEHQEYPKEILDAAREGKPGRWTSPRGVTYGFSSSGSGWVCIPVLSKPEGMPNHSTSDWNSKRVGRHSTIAGAFEAAFAAVPEEIDGLEESSPRTLDVLSGPC